MKKLNDLDVRLWLGGRGNFHIDQCIDILVDIVNGDYTADQLKQDILDNHQLYDMKISSPNLSPGVIVIAKYPNSKFISSIIRDYPTFCFGLPKQLFEIVEI